MEAFVNDGVERQSLNIRNSLTMIDESAVDEESITSETPEKHDPRKSSISHKGLRIPMKQNPKRKKMEKSTPPREEEKVPGDQNRNKSSNMFKFLG